MPLARVVGQQSCLCARLHVWLTWLWIFLYMLSCVIAKPPTMVIILLGSILDLLVWSGLNSVTVSKNQSLGFTQDHLVQGILSELNHTYDGQNSWMMPWNFGFLFALSTWPIVPGFVNEVWSEVCHCWVRRYRAGVWSGVSGFWFCRVLLLLVS